LLSYLSDRTPGWSGYHGKEMRVNAMKKMLRMTCAHLGHFGTLPFCRTMPLKPPRSSPTSCYPVQIIRRCQYLSRGYLCVLYVHLVMKRNTHRRSSRGFLFGTFSFVGSGGYVDNFAPRALCRVSFHAATWEDRTGGGGVLRLGTCEKPVAEICPASCPYGFRKDRTLSRVLTRIRQDGSGNRTQPGGLYHER